MATKPKNLIRFGKRALEGIEHPKAGRRVIYTHEDYPRLKLRVTNSRKTFFFEGKEKGQHLVRTIGSFPNISVPGALEKAKYYSAAITQGRDLVAEERDRKTELTMQEVWDDYKDNRKRRQEGKQSDSLQRHWDKHLSKWKDKRLSEISPGMARDLVLTFRKQGKPIGGNRVHTTGKAMFNHAIQEMSWEGKNPFLFSKASEAGRARDRRLEPHEVRSFLEGLSACSTDMADIFRLLLFTGKRPLEVQSMRFEDLDLQAQVWHLPTTKVGKRELVGLSTPCMEVLSRRWAAKARNLGPGEQMTGFVFASHSRAGYIVEIKGGWAKVMKKSGLKGITPRDLRTTTSSWAQEQEIPTAVVSKILGHGSQDTTAKHYTSVLEKTRRDAMEITAAAILEAAEQ